jgi:hypothetical protein
LPSYLDIKSFARAGGAAAALALALSTPAQAAPDDVKIAVSFPGGIGPDGAPVVDVQVRIPPDAENRRLRISIISDAYYRSSEVQLDGLESMLIHMLSLKEVPGGDYLATAIVFGADDELVRGRYRFRILSDGEGE